MLPPERTTRAGPLAAGLAREQRRDPTAPAPSTTSFDRSSRSTIASVISSSATWTMSSSSESSIPIVSSPGYLTKMPSAIVKPRLAGLHADDPHVRLDRAQRGRDARREPAAADGDQHRRRVAAPARRARARSSPGPRSRAGPRTDGRRSRPSPRHTPAPPSSRSRAVRPRARARRRSSGTPRPSPSARRAGRRCARATPASRAAHATAWPWLPALAATTPARALVRIERTRCG